MKLQSNNILNALIILPAKPVLHLQVELCRVGN